MYNILYPMFIGDGIYSCRYLFLMLCVYYIHSRHEYVNSSLYSGSLTFFYICELMRPHRQMDWFEHDRWRRYLICRLYSQKKKKRELTNFLCFSISISTSTTASALDLYLFTDCQRRLLYVASLWSDL